MNIIETHPALFAIGIYWLFSAIVGGMPPPEQSSSKSYTWAHDSLHILAGNLTAAIAQRYPQLPAGAQRNAFFEEHITVPPLDKSNIAVNPKSGTGE